MPITFVDKADLDIQPINWLGMHRQYLNAGEMEIIAALVRSVEARIVAEFGCRDGRTAFVLLNNVPSLKHYVGIDVPLSYLPVLAHQKNEMVQFPGLHLNGDPRFELIIRERGTLDLMPSDLPVCDVCFIDGDHSEAVVTHDSELANSIVRPGGLIIWHDYNQSPHVDVTRVLDRLHAEGWPIKHVKDTWVAFMRA